MPRLLTLLAAALLWAMPLSSALAVNPDEVLDDPALEQRARTLSVQIRCLVCQNQSIDDSDAPLARDLRVLVREQLVEGKSDSQILDHLVERYGEFVLLKPAVNQRTLVLWATPFVLLLLGGAAIVLVARRRAATTAEPAALSAQERDRLASILEDKGPKDDPGT